MNKGNAKASTYTMITNVPPHVPVGKKDSRGCVTTKVIFHPQGSISTERRCPGKPGK